VDIHHIKYFLAVCETLNFTRAAEQCGVTQPALSRAIQQLEDEVGGLLFRRERSLSHLTDLGRLMKPRLEEVLTELGQATREAKRFLTMSDAKLTVGIMCTVGPVRFAGLLAEFRKRHQGAEVSLVEGVPERFIAALEEGKVDAALMSRAMPYPPSLKAEPLYRERFLVAFAAGHRFGAMNAVPLAALSGESYLDRVNCEHSDRIDSLMQSCGANVTVCYASEREDWLQNMAAGGMGVCLIPEFSATAPGLVTRPVVEPEIWREICIVTLAGQTHAPSVVDFLETVKAHEWPEGGGGSSRVAA
jgi:DNA-binding transcriptional LysR family regulator